MPPDSTFEYKFVVNGSEWQNDPMRPMTDSSDRNNILVASSNLVGYRGCFRSMEAVRKLTNKLHKICGDGYDE